MTDINVHDDTVDNAAATPELDQPWAELGLKEDEYARIREILGRRPTDAELAMYEDLIEYCTIVVAILPIFCFYPFILKYFTKGMMIGSLKG